MAAVDFKPLRWRKALAEGHLFSSFQNFICLLALFSYRFQNDKCQMAWHGKVMSYE